MENESPTGNGKTRIESETEALAAKSVDNILPPPMFGDAAENAWMQGQEKEPTVKGVFTVSMTKASDIIPETINWLWYPYLPLGKLCLLGGNPGLGKTWVALGIAAAYSQGAWPFLLEGQPSLLKPGSTLFCASEDGMADTLVPRLMTMGANLGRIVFLEGKRDFKGALHRIVLNEESILDDAIIRCQAKLLVFDPFQQFLPPRTKMNEMETVRPVVDALIRLAARNGCAVLLLGHLNKAKQDTLGYKFLGSIDWFAASRSALMIIPDKDEPLTKRVLYQIKNSLVPAASGVEFSLTKGDQPFQWGQTTAVSAEEMYAGAESQEGKSTAAQEFLLRELANGEQRSDDLIMKAEAESISRRSLFRAKKALSIVARKGSFSGAWYWHFPEEDAMPQE